MPTPAHALSCITCRSRKVRCDKAQPCSACRRSGVECVFPVQRAQRKKHGRRNEELLRRLDHLEGLVDRLGGEVAVTAHAASGEPLPQPEQQSPADVVPGVSSAPPPHPLRPRGPPREDGTYPVMKEDGGRYLGEDFWTSLSTEVDGLRELLNEPESDEEPASTAHTSGSPPPAHDVYEKRLMNSLFVFSGDIEATDLRWLHPPAPQIRTLSDVYWDRVDPIYKVLHRPTTEPLLFDVAQDTASIPKGAGYEALLFAMYFAAVTSLTTDECLELLGKERANLAGQFRHCCEISLANADFLNSTDMQVLQAFSLYLVVLRCHNKTRSVWTLVSLAVRIGQDLNLHRDGSVTGFSPFETEMRRRLWWQIAVLDIRACEDRGSFPLIDHGLCSTKMPLNINDNDITPDTRFAPPERTGCTDLSFSRLCQEASMAAPKFFSPAPADVDDDQKRDQWQAQIQDEVERFKERLHDKFIMHVNPSIPIQFVISQVAQIVTSEFWLLVHYPIQTRRYAFKSKATKQEILNTAITHLRVDYGLQLHPSSSKYKWYYETYVQWHPLAVALAELCVQTRGALVDEAWSIVDAVYERARSRVTDVSLWRPVRKLHQKARRARATALRGRSGTTTTTTTTEDDEMMMSGTGSLETSESPASISERSMSQLPLDNLDRYLATTAGQQQQQQQQQQQAASYHSMADENRLAAFVSVLPSSTPSSTAASMTAGQHQTHQQIPPQHPHPHQQAIPTTTPVTIHQQQQPLDILCSSAVDLSGMSLDAVDAAGAYGDPVNWQDWDDFVRSTWAAEDPNAPQQKTNTPEWLLDMGMGG